LILINLLIGSSTSAILNSPSGKWDVEETDLLNSNKIIKRKLDFGSNLVHSKSPQIDADILYEDNINLNHSSIHYRNYGIYFLFTTITIGTFYYLFIFTS